MRRDNFISLFRLERDPRQVKAGLGGSVHLSFATLAGTELSASRFVVQVGSAVCFLFATVFMMHNLVCASPAQLDGGQSKPIPYQRVFVPSNDLGSIGIDAFRQVEVKRLEELIDNYAKQAIEASEQGFDNSGVAELVSSFYVAKLVGADLLSERSRLAFAGEARAGEGIALRPWTLAIQSPTSVGERMDTFGLSNWSFDGSGMPRITPTSVEPLGSRPDSRRNRFKTLFGWSSKAVAESTTNNLKFSFDIPKCANSCLVLSLPPQAVIQDSVTVVKRIMAWSSIDARLSEWDDFAKGALREQSPESLWLIELGGSSIASFTIALGADNRSKEDMFGVESQPYKYLISSQKMEHFIDEQMVRTTSEAILLASQRQMMRIRLAPNAKLRRLTVNQQDVVWEMEDGWIQWRMGGASVRSEEVYVECFTTLTPEMLPRFELPKVEFDRSYVMSGTEVVNCELPWRLTQSECETGRLLERPVDPKLGVANRLEYSWYAIPPKHVIGLERIEWDRRSEVLTRVTNDLQGIAAVIHARLFFAEQDANHMSMVIAPQWTIGTIQSLDPSDMFTIQAKEPLSDGATALSLNWSRLQKSRIAEVDIHLRRTFDISADPIRRIGSRHLTELPGWKRSDTLIVDEVPLFDFRLRDALCDLMVSDESIPEWQKGFAPREGKHVVFRFESPSSDGTMPHGLNGRSDAIGILSAPPELTWHATPIPLQAKVKSEIDRINDTTFIARHEIHLSVGTGIGEFVSIELPSEGLLWRKKEGEEWIALSPLELTSGLSNEPKGVWRFDAEQLGPECQLMAVVQSELSDQNEVTFRIPRVLNARLVSQEVRSVASDIAIHSSDQSARWDVDASGNKYLKLVNTDERLDLFARKEDATGVKKWFALESALHVAIDALGTQKGTLVLRSVSSARYPFTVGLADGWNPASVRNKSKANTRNIPFRMDGRRLVVLPEPSTEGEFEIRIELTGPRLARRNGFSPNPGQFLFTWPKFVSDAVSVGPRCFLWLPKEMRLAGSDNSEKAMQHDGWLAWLWTQTVIDALFGSAHSTENEPRGDLNASSLGLVPDFFAGSWRMVLSSARPNEFSSLGEAIWIKSVESDRTMVALLFVLFAIVTPRLMTFRFHIATLMAMFLIGSAHLLPLPLAGWASAGLVGMSTGFAALVVHRLLSKPSAGETSVSQRNSAKWSKWDERGAEQGSSVSHENGSRNAPSSIAHFGSLALCLAAGWSVSQAQVGPASIQDSVYQVVIPMDDDGNMAGTTVFVPTALLELLDGKPNRPQMSDRGTYPMSARYVLRCGVRGRNFNPDLLTMVYEFMVGEDLDEYRFPINVSQLQLPRFSVDGTELSLGTRLRTNGSEWIWTPDKPGRRTIQIVAQPILRANDSERNRELLIQTLDIAILPIANAQLDIETDFQNSAEVVARGRVTDPAAGRFVAMLGAVDRLQCNVITPILKSGAFASPSANTLENSEAPVMHTELLMQGELLQAKTILDFPKGITPGTTIEIEADSQWLPIGKQWGDADWVESRLGSTLGKRRYILEWRNTPSNANRQIATIWVPQPSSNNLNILFAECSDRRTRRGTLRYSRADANWNLDGISTWIPAIGSKDRLDWPEMSANPIATSLRIPSSGGVGGVLKHKLQSERAQARITTKWVVNANRESITSVINLRGGSSSLEPLLIDLPSDFTVTELYNGNGPIRYLQRRSKDKLSIQVLADRKSLEVSLLILQAKRQVPNRAPRFSMENGWQELPWVVISSSVNADQTLEVTASEHVALRLEEDPNVLLGRGLNIPTLNLAKSSVDIYQNTLASTRYQVACRDEPIAGQLKVSINQSSNPGEIEVLGQFAHTLFSRPNFILEVPNSLKDRLQSDARVRVIACPDPTKAWIQIALPEKSMSGEESDVSTLVRFVLKPDEPVSELELIRNIRPLDRDLITVLATDLLADESDSKEKTIEQSAVVDSDVASAPAIANWMIRIRDANFQATESERFVLVESEFWIEESKGGMFGQRILEWTLDDDVELLAIAIDGNPVVFTQVGRRVTCQIIQTGLCAEVVTFSKHPLARNASGRSSISPIVLRGKRSENRPVILTNDESAFGGDSVVVSVSSVSIHTESRAAMIGFISQLRLQMIENSLEHFSNSTKLSPQSDFDRWRRYWNQKAGSHLEEWALSATAKEQQAFGASVSRWHKWNDRSQTAKASSMSHTDFSTIHSELTTEPRHAKNWYSLVGCLLILLSVHLGRPLGPWLLKRPWWYLLGLGGFAWVVSGSLLPALILGGIGLFVAADSYWIVISRLRRTGTRGLRSL